jgi:fluoride exporter
VAAAVSAGGIIGAEARYAAGLIWPTARDAFPYTTFAVNVLGGFLGTMGAGLTAVLLTTRLTRRVADTRESELKQ